MPLFFLAGPVRGGGDWQLAMSLALEELCKGVGGCFIASPDRYEPTHPLWKYRADGMETRFPRQLNWERYYIERAAKYYNPGCLVFWLGCESKEKPHPGPEPYAMDTRGELGEWRGRMMHDKSISLVIGAEEGFFGLSQIQRNFSQALGYEFPIYPTIEKTAEAAVKLAESKRPQGY
jgi:hypothetical protein